MEITVEATIEAPIDAVWTLWTTPESIMRWNNASDDWHTPNAKNDLRPGGQFVFRMEAKNGSAGFDFRGVYDIVEKHKNISYTLGDGRKVEIIFTALGSDTKVTETFETESQNSAELQRTGWQAILNNFKKLAEAGV